MNQLSFRIKSLAQDEIARINYDRRNRISIPSRPSGSNGSKGAGKALPVDKRRAGTKKEGQEEDRSNSYCGRLQKDACKNNIQKQLTVSEFIIWYYEKVKAIHTINEEAFDTIVSEHYTKNPGS